LVGSAFIAPPWNLGTGASQAVLGIAGLGLALVFKRINTSKWLLLALAFSIAPALALDLIHAGYPKPAHIVSMMIGLVAGLLFVKPGYSKTCPR
jgi:predicted outer membrane lipoprotein